MQKRCNKNEKKKTMRIATPPTDWQPRWPSSEKELVWRGPPPPHLQQLDSACKRPGTVILTADVPAGESKVPFLTDCTNIQQRSHLGLHTTASTLVQSTAGGEMKPPRQSAFRDLLAALPTIFNHVGHVSLVASPLYFFPFFLSKKIGERGVLLAICDSRIP